ncbi:MAG: hypothetical protein LBK00_11485 [Treponema sp.]|nr:hypothetical protein [Treponema sp.]
MKGQLNSMAFRIMTDTRKPELPGNTTSLHRHMAIETDCAFQTKDLVKIARVITKYVHFLDPAIVAAIAEDNRENSRDWRLRLSALGVDPRLYLWEDSACCFPGVRRCLDAEKGVWRRGRRVFRDALAVDYDEYPRWVWSALIPERAAEFEGQRYAIFHPLNHKVINAQVEASLEENRYLDGRGLYGLFTSAANIAYAPAALIALMNTEHWLRTLFVERQAELYAPVSTMLPPRVRVRRSPGEWNLKAFDWAPCEGVADSACVRAFLEARRVKLDALLAHNP